MPSTRTLNVSETGLRDRLMSRYLTLAVFPEVPEGAVPGQSHGACLCMSDTPTWREACRCAVSNGVPRRSFLVALVVGAILNLINQGDALLAGRALDWAKIILTFAVPYCVSTYGAVSYHLKILRARDAGVSVHAGTGHAN